jgi:methionyl-tRNA formyltransferase
MPLAFTFQKNKQLKIIRSTILEKDGIWGKPGEVLSIENGKITVACQAGTLVFHQVLPEGKGRMTAADYINGRKIAVGDILGRR